jgi:hypothetical protein
MVSCESSVDIATSGERAALTSIRRLTHSRGPIKRSIVCLSSAICPAVKDSRKASREKTT